MRYKPKLGDEFPLAAELVAARTRLLRERTRSVIAGAIIGLVAVAIAITAAFCAYNRDFQPLQMLWAVVAGPVGWVIGHYFRGNGSNEDNYPSATRAPNRINGASKSLARQD